MESRSLCCQIAAAAAERKALNVSVIDVRGRCSYTDYLVLASGTSDRHVQAIAQACELNLKQEGVRCVGREGVQEGQWALVDYGDVVLHVFHTFTRDVYDLDAMWREAPRLRLELPASDARAPAPHWAPA